MIVQMQILFGEYLIANEVQLVHNFNFRALLDRRLGAVRPIGDVLELARFGDGHIVDSVKQFEAVHDFAKEMIRICLEIVGIENAFQRAIQANRRRLLNVAKILMIRVEDENKWR